MGCCGRRVFLLWIVEVIRAVILANAQWSVTMPGHITALTGSCVIIPCQFTCPWNYQPKEVVWYQYVSYGYPLVYSKNKPGGVIEKFRYKTELVGNATEKNCSLKIKDVHSTQNQEKIYVWIDPDMISYRDYKFYDTTVTLNVKDVVAPPEMSVTGEQTEGKTIKVYCTAVHTCPSSPPSLSFGDQQGSIQVSHTKEEMGQWRVTAEISWKAHDEDHGKMVSCTITHPGNRNATMRVALIVTSSPSNVSVTQHPGRPLEGQPVNLSCLSQSYPPAKSYRWYRVQRGHMVQQEGESQNLYLAKVSRDTGYYSCSARNDFGEASSKIRLINIEY
ncbi:myelin-associated glycoprotein-like [Scleropages formosus]|nr:myelin-associated glycoprotein-like [Scleropages formosus]